MKNQKAIEQELNDILTITNTPPHTVTDKVINNLARRAITLLESEPCKTYGEELIKEAMAAVEQRKQGRYKLVYDKSRTIIAVPNPDYSPDCKSEPTVELPQRHDADCPLGLYAYAECHCNFNKKPTVEPSEFTTIDNKPLWARNFLLSLMYEAGQSKCQQEHIKYVISIIDRQAATIKSQAEEIKGLKGALK